MKENATISEEILHQCMAAISGTDAVIVGGQALAFWADYFDIEWSASENDNNGITRDLDVFGDKAHLIQMSSVLKKAHVQLQNPRFISALIGTIEIPLDNNLVSNIDVIHTIAGLKRDEVRRHAVKVNISHFECNMMHPMHVLESRLKNLEMIPEKRNRQGINQAALAVLVVNRYIARRAADNDESTALKAIEKVVGIAKISAGKWAAKYGVSLMDAIPFAAIKNQSFQQMRRPQILNELAHLLIK